MSNTTKHLDILSTNDYKRFKELVGNRKKDEKHIKELMASMADGQVVAPIQINEKYEVIDGQHRLEACTRLKLPVYYYIIKGASLSTVQKLNSHTKNWSTDDYLGSWIIKDVKDYKLYREFNDTYHFPHRINLMLLGDTYWSNNNDAKAFIDGTFKIKSMPKAVDLANKITQIQPFYDGFKRRSFVAALVRCIKTPGFDFKRFLGKLEYQSRKLVDCSNERQYLELLEEIYNFKNVKSEKLNLRIQQ